MSTFPAIQVTLHRRISETALPCNGALHGVPVIPKRIFNKVPPASSFSYWWRWDDDLTMPPQHLITGDGQLSVPFDAQGRPVRLFQIAKAGNTPSDPLIAEGAQTVIDTSSSEAIRHIWVAFSDVSNPTADDDLFEGVIPENLLAEDGQRVECLFAGSYASNANEKYPIFKLAGNVIFSSAESPNGGFWKAQFSITRTDTDAARVEFILFGGAGTDTEISKVVDISGLDFTSTLGVVCRGVSDANNDITLKVTNAIYYSAASEGFFVVDDDGAIVVDDDGAFVWWG